MTPAQTEMLAEIQRLALAGAEQTDTRMWHQVRADQGRYACSDVRVMDRRTLRDLHRTTVMIDRDGYDEPAGIEKEECTLAQQRDELARWIAANRRREDAA